ncbi:MAG: type II toxin-antitoxin system HicA family toxin [Prevotella sp.]|nr:type II toxin-antitoxin system HicA family toxin [Prevotella sp.]
MNRQKLSNISLKDFRTFLFEIGCNRVRTEGGHEVWTKEGLTRPIVLQTHIDPIPEFIVQNTLRNLGITKKMYFEKIKQ